MIKGKTMPIQETHNSLVSFIWSIADDCLRDVYVRGKYRDVILPMIVLRRLDALLEPTKKQVLDEVKFQKEDPDYTEENLDKDALMSESGYPFYNISNFTMTKLKDKAGDNAQLLLTDVHNYLNGFSDNVKEILDKFELENKIEHMINKGVFFNVLEKFTSPYINLTSHEVFDPEGVKLPALTNLGMGYVFEELIRRFNEQNNEEAGEHFTSKEIIKLMTHLVFDPIKDNIPPVMKIYDPACGSGGMLTESQNFISENFNINKKDIYLYGKEINDETYAICKSDMMIRGGNPKNIHSGSTLSTDSFSTEHFDFCLSNPPYGKSYATELDNLKDGKDIIDPRFEVKLTDYWGDEQDEPALPATSDGQLLFLMDMVSKMNPKGTRSRIASVHNGSSLFTGDAGSGASNIRRYLIENDLVDAIVQLPNNIFYNTGITTYIWVLDNNKPEHRQGKIQLIDASQSYQKLRKNLGSKNCELSAQHIQEITDVYLNMATIQPENDIPLSSLVFNNGDFGYYKIVIEQPNRLKTEFTAEKIADLRFDKSLKEPMQWLYNHAGDKVYSDLANLEKEFKETIKEEFELKNAQVKKLFKDDTWEKPLAIFNLASKLKDQFPAVYTDFNLLSGQVDAYVKEQKIKVSATEKKSVLMAMSEYDVTATKVISKVHKLSGDKLTKKLNELCCKEEDLANFGLFKTDKANEYIEYESQSALRDTENVPLTEDVLGYFKREVQPHVEDAWIDLSKIKIGYEISFNKYFYQHKPLRALSVIRDEILALEKEGDGLLMQILGE